MSKQNAKNDKEKLNRVRPATDILEREDGFHVFMDLPGVKKGDLVIDLQENELSVTAPVSGPDTAKERYAEVQFGPVEYYRAISVSDLIDREKIKAGLKDGVLSLHLPKVEKVLPKRIEIQAG